MSQPLGSPIHFEGDQRNDTAVGIYQNLMAQGYFRPSSSTTLPSVSEHAPGPEPQAYVTVPTTSTKTTCHQTEFFAPIYQHRATYSPPPPLISDYSPPLTPTPTAYPSHAPASLKYHPPRATAPHPNHPYPSHAPVDNPTYNAFGPNVNPTYNNTYALPVTPTHATYGPRSTMPRLASSNIDPSLMPHPPHNPAYVPVYQQPIYTPGSITYEMIATRIQCLLQDKLTACHMSVLATLSSTITNRLVTLGTAGKLGACGLETVNDIFMVIGHEGDMSYMALAVIAPEELRLLLKGPNTDVGGKDALNDPQALEWLRQGFHDVALSEWETIAARMKGIWH